MNYRGAKVNITGIVTEHEIHAAWTKLQQLKIRKQNYLKGPTFRIISSPAGDIIDLVGSEAVKEEAISRVPEKIITRETPTFYVAFETGQLESTTLYSTGNWGVCEASFRSPNRFLITNTYEVNTLYTELEYERNYDTTDCSVTGKSYLPAQTGIKKLLPDGINAEKVVTLVIYENYMGCDFYYQYIQGSTLEDTGESIEIKEAQVYPTAPITHEFWCGAKYEDTKGIFYVYGEHMETLLDNQFHTVAAGSGPCIGYISNLSYTFSKLYFRAGNTDFLIGTSTVDYVRRCAILDLKAYRTVLGTVFTFTVFSYHVNADIQGSTDDYTALICIVYPGGGDYMMSSYSVDLTLDELQKEYITIDSTVYLPYVKLVSRSW